MTTERLKVTLVVGWRLSTEEVVRAARAAKVEIDFDGRIDDPADTTDVVDALARHLECVWTPACGSEDGDDYFVFGPDGEIDDNGSMSLEEALSLIPKLATLHDRMLAVGISAEGGARIFVSISE